MDTITKKWFAELDRRRLETPDGDRAPYRAKVFDEGNDLIFQTTSDNYDELINTFRGQLSKLIKQRFGKDAGYSLSQSNEVEDFFYHIPIEVFHKSDLLIAPNYDSKPKDPLPKDKDTIDTILNNKDTNEDEVSFTNVSPKIPGYYWYTQDGGKNLLRIVSVEKFDSEFNAIEEGKEEEQDKSIWFVQDYHNPEGGNRIEDYETEGALWSKHPIKFPDIDEREEIKAVDHQDW